MQFSLGNEGTYAGAVYIRCSDSKLLIRDEVGNIGFITVYGITTAKFNSLSWRIV